MSNPSKPAVFLDKDGTIIRDVPYNVDLALMELMPGAGEALRMLADAGFALIVVSNQSGVARGMFPEAALTAVFGHLQSLLDQYGVQLAGSYYCPHHPAGSVEQHARPCTCRKPAPGLLERAARAHGIDLAASWMVGDILNDVEAGNRAGCSSLLVDSGGETEWRRGPCRTPWQVVPDLAAAADVIVATTSARSAPPPARLVGRELPTGLVT